ncbi:hypothetical protein [Massilia sp. Dwa41.01b]|uniref:hypothetical protein n=1 Tax=Massilia sp. Dwa41.01b TaxID=2709302 RepID=UPI001E2A1427|nr:hypothetical protein [Massilia sp. Dwa41.01b]
MDDHTPPTPATPAPTPAKKPRRWSRRVAIGLVATGFVIGGAAWYLGRETTLQMIAERVARSTGGKLTLSGVRGSLYGAMHIDRIVWRTDEQLAIATNIDLKWSPRQLLSKGIAINSLHAADLRMETLKETDEKTKMPASLASPFPISLDDARLAKATFVSKGAATEITNVRMRLHGDKLQWQLRDAAATTPRGAACGQRQYRRRPSVQAGRHGEPVAGQGGTRRHAGATETACRRRPESHHARCDRQRRPRGR